MADFGVEGGVSTFAWSGTGPPVGSLRKESF